MFEKFLRQQRAPVGTVISFGLTIVVSILLLTFGADRYCLVRIPATVLVLAAGVVLNGLLGLIALSRDEHRGLEVAVGGIMLWFVTVSVLACSGRYW
jgi:hypothetical protein